MVTSVLSPLGSFLQFFSTLLEGIRAIGNFLN